MTLTTGLMTASAIYLSLANGRPDPGTTTAGDDIHSQGRVLTTPAEARGLVAWLHGVKIAAPDLLSAAVSFRDAVICTHDTGYIDEPIGIAVLNNGRIHLGQIEREISKSCCLYEALILNGRVLSESNTYPDGEPSVYVHWDHPLTGMDAQFLGDDVLVRGQLYGPGCLGEGWLGLRDALGKLSRDQLETQVEAGGWTRHETVIGRLYTRGDQAIWNGKPLDLKLASRGLEAARAAVA